MKDNKIFEKKSKEEIQEEIKKLEAKKAKLKKEKDKQEDIISNPYGGSELNTAALMLKDIMERIK